MKNRFMGKSKVVPAVCFVLIAVLSSSCGILPKINTNPANRTREEEIQSTSTISDPSGNEGPTETEEILDPFEQQERDIKESQETFFHFFDEAYDQYLKLQDIDLSDVLDMSYKPCVELAEELQKAVEERRTAVKDGTASIPEKLPYDLIIHGPALGGSPGDNTKFAAFICVQKPAAEQGNLSDEEYLSQYPPFLKFGVNCFYLYKNKADGKWSDWKIENFYEPHYFMSSLEMIYQNAVQSFYEEAWNQYIALEYTGLQAVMDEVSKDYLAAESLLKNCIEERIAHPETGTPEKLDYRIRIIETTLNAPGGSWKEIGTVRFELEPDPDLMEGESLEEKLKEYPAFMEFGEHYWSIHAEQDIVTDKYGDHYLFSYSIEELNVSPNEKATVKSLVGDEMYMTVNRLVGQAANQYVRMEEPCLSELLDLPSEEYARIVEKLKKATEARKESEGTNPEQILQAYEIVTLGVKYQCEGEKGTQDASGAYRFRLFIYHDAESWNVSHPGFEFTEEEYREFVPLPSFIEEMEGINAFSFNWDDGTCKIDGFDAWEMFEGE